MCLSVKPSDTCIRLVLTAQQHVVRPDYVVLQRKKSGASDPILQNDSLVSRLCSVSTASYSSPRFIRNLCFRFFCRLPEMHKKFRFEIRIRHHVVLDTVMRLLALQQKLRYDLIIIPKADDSTVSI